MDMTDRIIELLSAKGIAVTTFETENHMGKGAIKRFRSSSPSVDKIVLIAELLGVSAGYLIDGLKSDTSGESALDERESNLLLHYRALDLDGKARVDAVAANEHDRVKLEGDNQEAAPTGTAAR